MKASMAKSIPLLFLAALIPGLANAIEIKTSQTPRVHVQVPHGGTAEFKGPAQSHAIKLPGKTKHDITVNRGVTSNQSFQQWQQGVSGTKTSGDKVSGGYKIFNPKKYKGPNLHNKPNDVSVEHLELSNERILIGPH